MLRGLLAAAAALLACTPAHSITIEFDPCDPGACDPFFGTLDYTVPSDGQRYKWTFVVSQPGATFSIAAPNQVESYGYRRTASGYESVFLADFSYVFDETVAPNVTTIFVWAPKDRSFACAQIGELCSAYHRVWGNGAGFYVDGLPPDGGRFDLDYFIEPVPEPAVWTMMLTGFGAAGMIARKRQQALTPG